MRQQEGGYPHASLQRVQRFKGSLEGQILWSCSSCPALPGCRTEQPCVPGVQQACHGWGPCLDTGRGCGGHCVPPGWLQSPLVASSSYGLRDLLVTSSCPGQSRAEVWARCRSEAEMVLCLPLGTHLTPCWCGSWCGSSAQLSGLGSGSQPPSTLPELVSK